MTSQPSILPLSATLPVSPQEAEPENVSPQRMPAVGKHVRDVVLALIDQVFISATTFVTMMLVAKLCPRNELNLYVLVWAILNFFRVIQERALAAPYVVFAHERDRDTSSFLGNSLVFQGCFALISCVAFGLMAISSTAFDSLAGLGTCLWMVAAAIPFVLLRDHLRAISCAHFRYGIAVCLSGSALAIQLTIMLAGYRFGLLSASLVFVAMGVASLIPALVWLHLQPQPFKFNWSRLRPDWLTTINYSQWLIVARFFPTAVYSVLPWLVLWIVNEDAAGGFGSCLTLANISMMFVLGSNNLFQPRAVQALHRDGKSAMTKILGLSSIVFAVVLSTMCLIYLVAGSRLLEVIFDKSLAGYGSVLTLLGLHVLIVSFSIVAGNGMAALEKPKGIFWGELAWSIVTIVAAFFLTISYGLVGTAVALCLGSLTATLLEGGVLMHLLKQNDSAQTQGEI